MSYVGTVAATSASLVSIDVPKDGRLLGVQFAGGTDMDADGDTCEVELSFGSSGTQTINDTRSRIAAWSFGIRDLGTAGAGINLVNQYTDLPDISVGAGERIFLHGVASNTQTARFLATLYFDFELDKTPTRRR
jgi:hypothetical protein